MLEQVLQAVFLIAVVGLIFVVLYQILKAISGFFLIGMIGCLAFMEVYGIYLFFTERTLYVKDFATNGIWSFTTFYIAFNVLLVLGLVMKVVRSRMV
ncbi:DUF5966 family protein [Streptococcus sp. ZJ93]|uniref:DUF5966 family protein n=1 Tax=Streptococcus handemini TaxID=3161188 RepID=UPI0032ECBA1F